MNAINLTLNKQSTILEALEIIEKGNARTAFVCESKKLIGVISDGDIRRALIDNNKFSQLKAIDLMNKNPLIAFESDNLQVAEKRMREAKVQCLVVKNKSDEVVGVIQIFE